MIVQCCSCGKVRQSGHWVSISKGKLAEKHVSHGYCPVCAEKAYAEIREFVRLSKTA